MKIYRISQSGNHRLFKNKQEALAFLSEHPLMSVEWIEGAKSKTAIYWNGKLTITNSDETRKWVRKFIE